MDKGLARPSSGANHHPVGSKTIALTWTLLLVVLSGLGSGCQPKHPYVWANDLPASSTPVEQVPLRPGDQIVVQVPRMEELESGAEPRTVNADGTIVLPLIGVLELEGLTPRAAERKINARLNGVIVNPDARISVVNPRLPIVTVLGEVNTPGRYDMDHGDGLLPALARAGGLTEFADTKSIYLIRKYPQRQRIRFRYADLVGGVPQSTEFVLRDGDVIVVK